MTFGWMILLNGLIGAIIYMPAVLLFEKFCYSRFGKQESDSGLNDVQREDAIWKESVGISEVAGKVLAFALAIFLWEIELPLRFAYIYETIKERTNNGI